MVEIVIYFYNSFRLISIVYNILIILLLYRKVRSFNKTNPVFELIKRLIYYPVIQIVTIAPTTWFFYQYDLNDDYDNFNTPTLKASSS
jgi:hypothetical protein